MSGMSYSHEGGTAIAMVAALRSAKAEGQSLTMSPLFVCDALAMYEHVSRERGWQVTWWTMVLQWARADHVDRDALESACVQAIGRLTGELSQEPWREP